jgi:hypothetical protein
MKICVLQLCGLAAACTFAAGVSFSLVFAKEVLCQRQRHRQAASAFRTGYQYCVRQHIGAPHFQKSYFGRLLAHHIAE